MTKLKYDSFPSRNPESDMPDAITIAIHAWVVRVPKPVLDAIKAWAVTLDQRERAVDEVWDWMLTQLNREGRAVVGEISRERRERERLFRQTSPLPESCFTDCDKPGPRP